jgi:hypothetical protein
MCVGDQRGMIAPIGERANGDTGSSAYALCGSDVFPAGDGRGSFCTVRTALAGGLNLAGRGCARHRD